jgi:hypothetical protein
MNSKKWHEKGDEKYQTRKKIKRYCTRVGFPFFMWWLGITPIMERKYI